jgi:predicted acylesterase/phospholipase RssA
LLAGPKTLEFLESFCSQGYGCLALSFWRCSMTAHTTRDQRFDFNPGGRQRVLLSIDGGGMRGTIASAMLAELEQQLGKPVYDLVDMVGGTSTGAIIAAAISLRMTAQEILQEVYKKRLPRAFGRRGLPAWLNFAVSGFRHLYDQQRFVQELAPLAAGKRIRDLKKPIVLMTTKDLRTSNTYFIVSAGPGASMFADWPVTGAVAASGAAPVYFQPVLGNLVDGGVGVYTNPCLATAVEAMEYIGAAAGFVDGAVIHLSLGTGWAPNNSADGSASRWHLVDWIQYAIGESQEDATLQQALVTRSIYGQRTDFRRYDPLLTVENVRDVLNVAPGAVDPARLGLDSTDAAEIELMEAIGRAYAQAVDWRVPAVMPWDTIGGRPKPGSLPVRWAGTPFDR